MYREPVLVAFHHELVSSADEGEVVDTAEFLGDLPTEEVPSSTAVDSPVIDILGVRPHEITEGSFVWDLDLAIDGPDLVDGAHVGGEPTVHAEDSSLHQCGEWQAVEDFHEEAPRTTVAVLSKEFLVEAVHLGALTRFVVASEEGDVAWVLDYVGLDLMIVTFEAEEVFNGLDGVEPSVDEISNEDVVGLGELATFPEEGLEVKELA